MQTIELDPTLSQTLDQARQAGLTLVIGNKNYSSWSMRPWVAAVAAGIPFTEVRVLLDQSDTAANIARFSHAGRVPVLLAGDMAIWDSLAICLYPLDGHSIYHLGGVRTAELLMQRLTAKMHRELLPWTIRVR